MMEYESPQFAKFGTFIARQRRTIRTVDRVGDQSEFDHDQQLCDSSRKCNF